MAAPPPDWLDGTNRFIQEARERGLVLHVFRPVDAIELLGAALLGSEIAAKLLKAGEDLIRRINKLPAKKRPLCLCCPRTVVAHPAAIAFLIGAGAEPGQCLGMFICQVCGNGLDYESTFRLALAALKTNMPELRDMPAPTHPAGGRA